MTYVIVWYCCNGYAYLVPKNKMDVLIKSRNVEWYPFWNKWCCSTSEQRLFEVGAVQVL